MTDDLPKDPPKFAGLLQQTKAELSIRINGYLIEAWDIPGSDELEITIDGKVVDATWRQACTACTRSEPKPFGED